MEGDLSKTGLLSISWTFLPTPSHGGRPSTLAGMQRRILDFYPRPHMEGDLCALVCSFVRKISTHALTWRATGFACGVGEWRAISTHALTWRATRDRAREYCLLTISTHALTWRATYFMSSASADVDNFYPRPHMEGDMRGEEMGVTIWISTHALTWRATYENVQAYSDFEFLPTPSHGGRPAERKKRRLERKISTHALTWRATSDGDYTWAKAEISTHALTWRATRQSAAGRFGRRDFYPRPHMEGDQPGAGKSAKRRNFYPRPHMEGDECSGNFCPNCGTFLPTPSHGGRQSRRCWIKA